MYGNQLEQNQETEDLRTKYTNPLPAITVTGKLAYFVGIYICAENPIMRPTADLLGTKAGEFLYQKRSYHLIEFQK